MTRRATNILLTFLLFAAALLVFDETTSQLERQSVIESLQ